MNEIKLPKVTFPTTEKQARAKGWHYFQNWAEGYRIKKGNLQNNPHEIALYYSWLMHDYNLTLTLSPAEKEKKKEDIYFFHGSFAAMKEYLSNS